MWDKVEVVKKEFLRSTVDVKIRDKARITLDMPYYVWLELKLLIETPNEYDRINAKVTIKKNIILKKTKKKGKRK